MNRYTHIIWDWNGTLLDDVDWSMETINTMLKKRGLHALETVEAYHGAFGFPVIDYYRRVGLDFEKEPFEKLAAEYVEAYYSSMDYVSLYPDAEAALARFRDEGLRQVILSASELKYLIAQVKPFGICAYFDEILGATDIYAAGKTSLGVDYIRRARPAKALLIGDTAHDMEVARALGADCVLVAGGHQGKTALASSGARVAERLGDVFSLLP